MNRKIDFSLILILVLFLVLPYVNAGLFTSNDITFSVNQTDYYFNVGENAIIPLSMENTYGKQIDGILEDTYSQEINQGGMQFSSSNTQSISFSVKDGNSVQNIDFGTSKTPVTLKVNLKFSYEEKESRVVNLGNINIHFVSDKNAKQNQENKQSSSSEKSTESSQSQNSGQDSFSQMQNKLNQMIGQQQNPQQQSTQQKLQNNQIKQDSSALKKQMEGQSRKQEQLKEDFKKNLSKNPDFQKENQKLSQQGYTMSSANFNPSSNNSGKFDLQYKNKNNEIAELKGEMENGKMKNMNKLTQEDKKKMMQELQKNKNFQKLNDSLHKNNYNQKNTEFSLDENKTNIKVNYQNEQNQTSTISAEIINGTIENVKIDDKLKDGYSKSHFLWWFLIFLAALIVSGYFIYNKYYKKSKKIISENEKKVIKEKPFDYNAEAKKLLAKSKKLFQNQKYKDAYEKAGQALRVYLSYKYGLKKETTNDEIISFLKFKNKNTGKIKQCFDLCSLVEFAKYNANKKDFNMIINIIENTINNGFKNSRKV